MSKRMIVDSFDSDVYFAIVQATLTMVTKEAKHKHGYIINTSYEINNSIDYMGVMQFQIKLHYERVS